jgi:hypothetical protein
MGVLLVDGLPGDPECGGDRLPGPTACPSVANLQCLEVLDELAQCRYRPQTDARVGRAGRGGYLCGAFHGCQGFLAS